MPGGRWRRRATVAVEAALVTAGDGRKRITWAREVVEAVTRSGFGLDHDGHVAPLSLMPPPTRAKVLANMLGVAAE